MKDCTDCEHFALSEHEPDWSEYTPGTPASIGCMKGHWTLGNEAPWTPKGFRLVVLKSKTCHDFKQADDL
jgi:hypothetical protein